MSFPVRTESTFLGKACADAFRFLSPIPLPASPEPPEALTGLVKIGIAIPRELCKGRACRGLEDRSVTYPEP